MSKVIDVRAGGGELVVLGRAIVLPASTTDGPAEPLDGSIRFNPTLDIVEVYTSGDWGPVATIDGQGIDFSSFQRAMIDAYVAGTLPSGLLHRFIAVGGMHIPQNLAGSYGKCTGVPASTLSLDIRVNGVSKGAISISTSGVFTFTTAAAIDLVAGDILTIEAGAANSAISQITLNILGAHV